MEEEAPLHTSPVSRAPPTGRMPRSRPPPPPTSSEWIGDRPTACRDLARAWDTPWGPGLHPALKRPSHVLSRSLFNTQLTYKRIIKMRQKEKKNPITLYSHHPDPFMIGQVVLPNIITFYRTLCVKVLTGQSVVPESPAAPAAGGRISVCTPSPPVRPHRAVRQQEVLLGR